jgi:macrolide-specific efflux system membrane fusion protein
MENFDGQCRALSFHCFRGFRGFLPLAAAWITATVAAAARAGDAVPLTIDSVVLRPLVEAEAPARQVGVLARIEVDEGALVQNGDLLASLDDRAAALKVQQAMLERDQAAAKAENRLSIDYADKALEVARAELRRSEESNQKFPGSISNSQLDVERLTIEKLELERQQAEHELVLARFDLDLKNNALQAAQLELELHAVRAPFSGVIALVRGRVGEWVEPGAPVLRLVAIDRLRAEGFAPAAAAESLLGASVRFAVRRDPVAAEEDAHGAAAAYEGRIGFVSPEIDPVTRQVRVWAEIDNADHRLRPGQQGKLQVVR